MVSNNPGAIPPLSEKDFIQNGWRLSSFPFWLWIFIMASLIGIIWGTSSWYQGLIKQEKSREPFLEVTNRDFSAFLWQFPSYLRVNVPKKTGYLPGFLSTSENFNSATAEEYVSAPPGLIFLYHTWHRLLAPDFIARPIPQAEFIEFLERLPEWKPKNWANAPNGYAEIIDAKKYTGTEDLQKLSEAVMPFVVRQAFQGWKNYFKEGQKINKMQPTYAQVQTLIDKHPAYARPYWRNIDEVENQQVAGSDYLLAMLKGAVVPDAVVPNDQLAPFLKVALFNMAQAQQNQ